MLRVVSIKHTGLFVSDLKDTGDSEVDGWVVSSESCSFGGIGAKYYREVLPGKQWHNSLTLSFMNIHARHHPL